MSTTRSVSSKGGNQIQPSLLDEAHEALAFSLLIFLFADLRLLSATGRIHTQYEDLCIDSDFSDRTTSLSLAGIDNHNQDQQQQSSCNNNIWNHNHDYDDDDENDFNNNNNNNDEEQEVGYFYDSSNVVDDQNTNKNNNDTPRLFKDRKQRGTSMDESRRKHIQEGISPSQIMAILMLEIKKEIDKHTAYEEKQKKLMQDMKNNSKDNQRNLITEGAHVEGVREEFIFTPFDYSKNYVRKTGEENIDTLIRAYHDMLKDDYNPNFKGIPVKRLSLSHHNQIIDSIPVQQTMTEQQTTSKQEHLQVQQQEEYILQTPTRKNFQDTSNGEKFVDDDNLYDLVATSSADTVGKNNTQKGKLPPVGGGLGEEKNAISSNIKKKSLVHNTSKDQPDTNKQTETEKYDEKNKKVTTTQKKNKNNGEKLDTVDENINSSRHSTTRLGNIGNSMIANSPFNAWFNKSSNAASSATTATAATTTTTTPASQQQHNVNNKTFSTPVGSQLSSSLSNFIPNSKEAINSNLESMEAFKKHAMDELKKQFELSKMNEEQKFKKDFEDNYGSTFFNYLSTNNSSSNLNNSNNNNTSYNNNKRSDDDDNNSNIDYSESSRQYSSYSSLRDLDDVDNEDHNHDDTCKNINVHTENIDCDEYGSNIDNNINKKTKDSVYSASISDTNERRKKRQKEHGSAKSNDNSTTRSSNKTRRKKKTDDMLRTNEVISVMEKAIKSRKSDQLNFLQDYFREGTISRIMTQSKSRVVWINDWYPIKDLIYAITVDEEKKRVSVLFRGAITQHDWDHAWDMQITRVYNKKFGNKKKYVRLFHGFYRYLFRKRKDTNGTTKYDEICNKVHYYGMKRIGPDYKVFVTGHSLGAGLSTVFGFFASFDDRFTNETKGPVRMITFGSPMVGGHSFRDMFRHQEVNNKIQYARFYNTRDIVVHGPVNLAPSKRGSTYVHVGLGIKLHRNNHIWCCCVPSKRSVLPDINYVGNEGTVVSYGRALRDNGIFHFPFPWRIKLVHSLDMHLKRLNRVLTYAKNHPEMINATPTHQLTKRNRKYLLMNKSIDELYLWLVIKPYQDENLLN